MTFESHKVVKGYMDELAKITETREQLRERMAQVWEQSYKTDDDEKRRAYVSSAKDLEQQINALTTKGQHCLLKVDQLNGVR